MREPEAMHGGTSLGVVIVGFEIPFVKLVGNLVVLTLAAIPAAFIAAIILAIGSAVFAGIIRGLVGAFSR
jgi:hypothetical protein